MLLDRKVPLLNGGSLGIGLNALRRKDGAGRGHAGAARRGGRRLHAGVIGSDGSSEPEKVTAIRCKAAANSAGSQIVDHRIIRSESGAHGGLAVAEWVPGQADAGAEQFGCVVFGVDGIADDGIGFEHAVGVVT